VNRASASAKINLALVVGPKREDGYHEVATVLQRVGLADRIEIEPSDELGVNGFAGDTLVRRALELVAAETGGCWRAHIEKRIPVASGLGGGSSDAATALALANATLPEPLSSARLHELAIQLGADVPFFLTDGPQLATGRGTELESLDVPQDFWILLVLPHSELKRSTAEIYGAFDGEAGFDERRAALLVGLDAARRPVDLAALPPNDLATSPLADDLRAAGAFRADVSGAGPAVYGLFVRERDATQAAQRLRARGRVWVTGPAWYG
jgi:4-diphosphocytidyl-2-C-methyl-D-erythritol kinase